MKKIKLQLEKDILSEQQRANEAERRATLVAKAEEQRVADLGEYFPIPFSRSIFETFKPMFHFNRNVLVSLRRLKKGSQKHLLPWRLAYQNKNFIARRVKYNFRPVAAPAIIRGTMKN